MNTLNTLGNVLVYLLVFAAIYIVIEEVLKPSERLKRLMLIILALIVILALLGLLFGHPWFPRFSQNLPWLMCHPKFSLTTNYV